jgi:hypothetical protein
MAGTVENHLCPWVQSWVQRWVQVAGFPRNPAQSYQRVSAILAPIPRFPYSP